MNLERSATHSPHRTGKGHDAAGSIALHGRDPADAGAGGFLSVLAALDGSDASGSLDAATELASLPSAADLATLPGAAQGGLPDSSQLSPDAGWQVDTAALLAHLNRSAQWSPPSSAVTTPGQDALVSSVGDGGSSAKVAPASISNLSAAASTSGLPMAGTALVTAPLDAANANAQGPLQARSPLREALDPTVTQSAASREAPAPDAPAAAVAGAAHRSAVLPMPAEDKAAVASGDGAQLNSPVVAADDGKGARWEAAQALLQHPANEATKPAGAAVGAAQTASETKARQALGGSEVLAQAAVASSAPALASVADEATRKTERVISKSTEPHRGAGGEGQWGPYALVSGRPVEASSAAQSAAMPTPEMMVAEQVSYWISGKVQNAELKLDVFGREPVDVSISMKGNEAQVEFRTDQPEVRQVLEGALGHLKTLLKDEGLSLAGVFVGSSGQQREGANPSPRQQGESAARRARVEVSEAVASVKPSGARPLAGRSVDLFV